MKTQVVKSSRTVWCRIGLSLVMVGLWPGRKNPSLSPKKHCPNGKPLKAQ